MNNNILKINAKTWLNIDLDDENLRMFDIYYELLNEWNTKINLTSITGYDEFMLKHVLDSLVPIKLINEHKKYPIHIVDVGTGAGFPGLPIKIINPELKMYLIESKGKKTEFLRHIVDTLNLKEVTIFSDRAEIIGKDSNIRESFDVVMARGVSRLDVLSELTLGLLKIGGIGVFHKGPDSQSELKESLQAIDLMGGKVQSGIKYQIANDRFGTLVKIDKMNKTPENLPRNPGMPEKKPLNSRFETKP